MSMIDELHTCADLWLLDESAVDQAVDDYGVASILSTAERARLARLLDPRGRRLYLGGRMLVRHVLAAYTGVAPGQLEFEAGPYGRPELVPNPNGLSFNLSHTTGLIGCVLTRGRLCGLDLERSPAARDFMRAVVQFLSADEREHLSTLTDGRDETTLEYWVVKEAYLKALGVGLTRSLDTFTVRRIGSMDVRIDDSFESERSWQIELQRLTTDHVVGLALARDPRSPARTPVRILDFDTFLRAAVPPPSPSTGRQVDGPDSPRAITESWPDRKEAT